MDSTQKASELFKSLPISQIREINRSLEIQSHDKTEQLRNLVGTKYRSLLATADNVVLMKKSVQIQDKQLSSLCDLNDSQSIILSKQLQNYGGYIHNVIVSGTLDKSQYRIIFRVLLVDLKDNLNKFKVNFEADKQQDQSKSLSVAHMAQKDRPSSSHSREFVGNSVSDLISNDLIQFAKEFVIFEQLIESSQEESCISEFQAIKAKFILFLSSLIVRANPYTRDYLTNSSFVIILTCIMLIEQWDAVSCLQHFAQLRLKWITKLFQNPKFVKSQSLSNFSKSFIYLYLSSAYFKVFFAEGFSSKILLNVLSRNLPNPHESFSLLISKYTVLRKLPNFKQFLDYEFKFKYAASDYKEQFAEVAKLTQILNSWKHEVSSIISAAFTAKLNYVLDETNESNCHLVIERLVVIVKNLVQIFKIIHTSESKKLYLNENGASVLLLDKLLETWKAVVHKVLTKQILYINVLTEIIDSAGSSESTKVANSYTLWTLDDNDLKIKNIDKYLKKITSISEHNIDGTHESAIKLCKISEYFTGLQKVFTIFKQNYKDSSALNDLNNTVDKSLDDDFNNDVDFEIYQNIEIVQQFWESYKKVFSEIYNEICTEFFGDLLFGVLLQNLSKLTASQAKDEASHYTILKILMTLKRDMNARFFQEHLEVHRLEQFNDTIDQSILKFNTLILEGVQEDFQKGLANILSTRFSDENVEPNIWDDGLPISPSKSLGLLMYNLNKELLTGSKESGDTDYFNFMDLFTTRQFKTAKDMLIAGALDFIEAKLGDNSDGQNMKFENVLITIADVYYLTLFASKKDLAKMRSVIGKICAIAQKADKDISPNDQRAILKNVIAFFSERKLLHLPLSA